MTIKKSFAIITFVVLSKFIYAQTPEMSVKKNWDGTLKIYYGSLPITYSKAKSLALSNEYLTSYEAFKNAKRVKNWSVIWGICAGLELSTFSALRSLSRMESDLILAEQYRQSSNLHLFYSLGYLGIAYWPNRTKKFIAYTNSGVEKFNNHE